MRESLSKKHTPKDNGCKQAHKEANDQYGDLVHQQEIIEIRNGIGPQWEAQNAKYRDS